MNPRETNRDEQWVQGNREELLERMVRALPEDGWIEALEGLFLARVAKPIEAPLALFQPAFCFVAQGGKQVLVGEDVSGTTQGITSYSR